MNEAYDAALSTLRENYIVMPDYLHDLDTPLHPQAPPTTNGSGYVVSTLNAARIAMQQSSFEDVIRTAVRFGDDTDTNAAVAGGLAGIVLARKRFRHVGCKPCAGATWLDER